MERYVVFLPAENAEEAILRHFPDTHYQLAPNLWVVGSSAKTCADICSVIGVGPEKPGVVTAIDHYYGHYDQALWQKLEAWGREA